LRLFNTGHKGVFCTVHANSPMDVLNSAFPGNIQLSGYDASNVTEQLKRFIDVIIQIKSCPTGKKVSEIYYPKTGQRRNLN
jgi:pilus assembly protein CpaF